jgi:hypothetical protein
MSVPAPSFVSPPPLASTCPTVNTFAGSAMSKPPPPAPQLIERGVLVKLVPVT